MVLAAHSHQAALCDSQSVSHAMPSNSLARSLPPPLSAATRSATAAAPAAPSHRAHILAPPAKNLGGPPAPVIRAAPRPACRPHPSPASLQPLRSLVPHPRSLSRRHSSRGCRPGMRVAEAAAPLPRSLGAGPARAALVPSRHGSDALTHRTAHRHCNVTSAAGHPPCLSAAVQPLELRGIYSTCRPCAAPCLHPTLCRSIPLS